MKCKIKECHGSFADRYYCLVISGLDTVTDGKIDKNSEFTLKFSASQYGHLSEALGYYRNEGTNPAILELFKILQWRLGEYVSKAV
jgi:hypothetical protein